MPSGFYTWSETAANNGSADSAINFAEGMSPSGLNDSGRMVMAVLRRWGSDTAGGIVTSGTSTAYALTSHQGFTSKALMDGAEIAFTVHATNGPAATLNVDGLGADTIIVDTSSGATPVPPGTLIAGGVYSAVYFNSGNNWRLKDFYQLPFTVPIGGMIDYFGTTAPSSNFVFPFGQAISRTQYATCFALFGTTYGTGDGTTTFNIPDIRGRVVAGKDDMGGSAANRLTASVTGVPNGAVLGGVGGTQDHTLTTAQLASHSHANTLTDPGHSHQEKAAGGGVVTSNIVFAQGDNGNSGSNQSTVAAVTGITINNASAGSGNAHNNTQPTIIANKLIRII
ncbi:tail fiber protein [Bradyrhizobium sp. 521_C7_N1_3]|uniref:tail fiber protein n=1 Tax=Bradyrhizobium sp. 521_C7_N1_3 TaxID=3240368 RepID=UPI003F88C412